MQEYVVERTLKRRIVNVLWLVFGTLVMGVFFLPKEWFRETSFLFDLGRIGAIIIFPIMVLGTIIAIKDIWNKNPYLIIREDGLIQNIAKYQSGLIRWEDIEDIKISPIVDGTCAIRIFLKNPEKYISNPKMLERLKKRRAKNPGENEITILTNEFKDETIQVLEHIQKFYKAQRERDEEFCQS
jgi:hypothetical protein